MMTNLSGAVVSLLYNYQLLRLAAEVGVAAYGAIMYVSFVLDVYKRQKQWYVPYLDYLYGEGILESEEIPADEEHALQELTYQEACLLYTSVMEG